MDVCTRTGHHAACPGGHRGARTDDVGGRPSRRPARRGERRDRAPARRTRQHPRVDRRERDRLGAPAAARSLPGDDCRAADRHLRGADRARAGPRDPLRRGGARPRGGLPRRRGRARACGDRRVRRAPSHRQPDVPRLPSPRRAGRPLPPFEHPLRAAAPERAAHRDGSSVEAARVHGGGSSARLRRRRLRRRDDRDHRQRRHGRAARRAGLAGRRYVEEQPSRREAMAPLVAAVERLSQRRAR